MTTATRTPVRRPSRPRALAVGALAAGVLALGATAGCSSEGAKTNCSLSACTVTFDRGVDASVDVLGVKAELVGVNGTTATVSVGGQQVQVPVGGSTEAGGFRVTVQEITSDAVVVVLARAE